MIIKKYQVFYRSSACHEYLQGRTMAAQFEHGNVAYNIKPLDNGLVRWSAWPKNGAQHLAPQRVASSADMVHRVVFSMTNFTEVQNDDVHGRLHANISKNLNLNEAKLLSQVNKKTKEVQDVMKHATLGRMEEIRQGYAYTKGLMTYKLVGDLEGEYDIFMTVNPETKIVQIEWNPDDGDYVNDMSIADWVQCLSHLLKLNNDDISDEVAEMPFSIDRNGKLIYSTGDHGDAECDYSAGQVLGELLHIESQIN